MIEQRMGRLNNQRTLRASKKNHHRALARTRDAAGENRF
jgi:hypothetical protein